MFQNNLPRCQPMMEEMVPPKLFEKKSAGENGINVLFCLDKTTNLYCIAKYISSMTFFLVFNHKIA